MGRKKNLRVTPLGIITSHLRKIFLISRERGFAIKRDKYTCQECNTKQSTKDGKKNIKIEVHHKVPIGDKLNNIAKMIRELILQTPEDLITLCSECHEGIHEKG